MSNTFEPTRWKPGPEGSNWGDFGADDQTGRLAIITPDIRRAALAEAREGECFVLSLPLDCPGGENADAYRPAPRLFTRDWVGEVLYNMQVGPAISSDDHVVMSLQYST